MSDASQDLPSFTSGQSGEGLGSLAQAARQKSLRHAKTALVIVGILTAGINAAFFALIPEQVQREIGQLQGQGDAIDQEAVDAIVRSAQLFTAGFVALGIVFIGLGLCVKMYPVPITVVGLVLYIGSIVILALIDPTTIAQGIIVKIIVVVVLVKAVQAAIAYQRDAANAPLPNAL